MVSGRRSWLRRHALETVIVVLTLFLALVARGFLAVDNITNVLRQISFNMIIATGMTMVVLTQGIDLSAGSIVALSGCIAAILMRHIGVVTSIFAGLLVGGACGLLNGVLVTKVRLQPFVATLGTMSIFKGLALMSTGGGFISGLPKSLGVIGGGYVWLIPVPVIIAAVILLVGHVVLSNTAFGLSVRAIGGNYEAARVSGINNHRSLLIVYAVSGVLSSLVGIILISRVSSAQPYFGEGYTLLAVTAVLTGGTTVAGGEGGVDRTMLGVLLMGIINNGLNLLGVHYFWQQVVMGVILLAAVLGQTLKPGARPARGESSR